MSMNGIDISANVCSTSKRKVKGSNVIMKFR